MKYVWRFLKEYFSLALKTTLLQYGSLHAEPFQSLTNDKWLIVLKDHDEAHHCILKLIIVTSWWQQDDKPAARTWVHILSQALGFPPFLVGSRTRTFEEFHCTLYTTVHDLFFFAASCSELLNEQCSALSTFIQVSTSILRAYITDGGSAIGT